MGDTTPHQEREASSGLESISDVDQRFGRVPGGSGWVIKTLPDGESVCVLGMAFNFRVVRSDGLGTSYDRAWCYYGSDFATMLTAVDAALAWDGEDGTEPEGWNKRLLGPAGTQREYRHG